jgi:translation initiation factor IF-2
MSIRLNKALRELNIGLQTAVEFLEKKSHLGEVKAEPSFKLNDEQYQALVEAFKQDAAVRTEAEKLFKKPKEKKHASERKHDHRGEPLLGSSARQQYTPLGKIDLDAVGKKTSSQESVAPVAEQKPEPETAAVSQATEAKTVETRRRMHRSCAARGG